MKRDTETPIIIPEGKGVGDGSTVFSAASSHKTLGEGGNHSKAVKMYLSPCSTYGKS